MPSSPVTEVFHRATRLALRAGASEVDIDILMLALDFEGGPARPVNLSKVDAMLARYRRAAAESSDLSSKESFGSGYGSEWIGFSSEVRAAISHFPEADAITLDSLREVLLAVKNEQGLY